jgi:hypothetical protein
LALLRATPRSVKQPVVPSVALRLDVTNRNAKSRDLLVWAALPNHAGDP